MNQLLNEIRKKTRKPSPMGENFTRTTFSAALLLYLNPRFRSGEIRCRKILHGIVFDIGRGAYDHHQKDSRIRETVFYAAFGLLWEALGAEILGEELALSLTRPSFSLWTIMTTPGRKMSWRLSLAISIRPGTRREARMRLFSRR
ncbi:MAG: hypothetical protein ACLUQB_13635 [Lachnospiraceae bacterium]